MNFGARQGSSRAWSAPPFSHRTVQGLNGGHLSLAPCLGSMALVWRSLQAHSLLAWPSSPMWGLSVPGLLPPTALSPRLGSSNLRLASDLGSCRDLHGYRLVVILGLLFSGNVRLTNYSDVPRSELLSAIYWCTCDTAAMPAMLLVAGKSLFFSLTCRDLGWVCR